MENTKWNIGICNWSFQSGVSEVAGAMKEIGINHVHLAIGPALADGGKEYIQAVKQQCWIISSAMISFEEEDYSTLETIKVTGGVVPDETWEKNKNIFAQAAKVTKQLGVKYLSMHAGFIDHTQVAKYRVMCGRIKCLADIAAANGIILLMETGQETAGDLADFIDEINHPAVGINFDPANMILYDKGDPVEAVKILSKWIKHVHIKDADKTEVPGQWGNEVPWGDGQVGCEKFLATLKSIGYKGVLAIEREAGSNRKADIAHAVKILTEYISRY